MKHRMGLLVLALLGLALIGFAEPAQYDVTGMKAPSVAEPVFNPAAPQRANNSLDEVIFYEDWESGTLNGWVGHDLTSQPSTWHIDDWNAFEGSGTSWWMGDTSVVAGQPLNGYLDGWYMALDSPPITLPAAGPTLRFWHRFSCENPTGPFDPPEYNGWDGMNIRISTNNGQTWTVIPSAAVTPAYDRTSLYSFGFEHGEGPNIPGWCGQTNGNTWHLQTANLSTWAGQTVKIRFAFASDPAYCTTDNRSMFGWQVDALRVYSGTDTVFSDDGNAIGNWTHQAVGPVGGDMWRVATDNTSPALPHVIVCNSSSNNLYGPNMDDVLESPYIDCRGLPFGQMIFDVLVTGEVMCEQAQFPDCDYWGMEVSVDSGFSWCAVSNPTCSTGGSNYVYIDCPTTWSSFNESYSIPMDFSRFIGRVCKFRFTFESNADAQYAVGPKFDGFSVTHTAGFANDVSCYTLQVRYPNVAGRPFKVSGYFRNVGSADQNDLQTWWRVIGSTWRPFLGVISLPSGGTARKDTMVTISAPTQNASMQARVALGSDENMDNDTSTVSGIIVDAAGSPLELGYDNHALSDTFYYFPRLEVGNGMMVHFTPRADGTTALNFNLNSIKAQFSDFQPQDNMPIRLHIYNDNAGALGDEIYNQLVTVALSETGAQNWKTIDVSGDADTRNMDNDFWVWFETVNQQVDNNYPSLIGDDQLGWADIHHHFYDGSGDPSNSDFYFQIHAEIVEVTDAAGDVVNTIPDQWSLEQNYPNPFNPTTEIRYSVPNSEFMTLKVYNLMGQEVATLISGVVNPGMYTANFDASKLASGVYVYRLESASFNASHKMLLMK